MMNPAFEALFEAFLNVNHTGEAAEETQRIGAEIDRQIDAGRVDTDTVAAYELAATRLGFYEGLKAGLHLGFEAGAGAVKGA